MAHFFHNAKSNLLVGNDAGDGVSKIIISLVDGQAERWQSKATGEKQQLYLNKVVRFDQSQFKGYVCKRNDHDRSFKNQSTQQSHQYTMSSLLYYFDLNYNNPNKKVHRPDDLNDNSVAKMSKKAQLEKPFECQTCARCFTTEHGLKNHIHCVSERNLDGGSERRESGENSF
jgi:hypothetical protein